MNDHVVSDSGPMMVFSKLNLLHLLKGLYGDVLIPFTVYEESVTQGIFQDYQDAYTLRLFLEKSTWKITKVLEIPDAILNANLDQGEKEAIALAMSKKALVLIDEELGRSVARQHNLNVKGSLGVLIEAYNKKLITLEQLKLYFEQISTRADIWISPKLCKRLLDEIEAKDN